MNRRQILAGTAACAAAGIIPLPPVHAVEAVEAVAEPVVRTTVTLHSSTLWDMIKRNAVEHVEAAMGETPWRYLGYPVLVDDRVPEWEMIVDHLLIPVKPVSSVTINLKPIYEQAFHEHLVHV